MGGRLDDGTEITPKYIGQRRLIEIAIATLATDRALLLLGVPGTAKTWVSEHLAAAISGDSTLLVQGTAGTTEESLRYGWNYALLLSRGPTEEALVPSPVYRAMREGRLVRVEELTRMPSEVQDALVTILSEKVLPIPELATELAAVGGFNLIATANVRDRGVNEMSSALRRRFNTVVLPLPATSSEEMAIVSRRVAELGAALDLPAVPAASEEIERVVTIFRELREGRTTDGRTSLKVPSGTLSTAEAISVITNGLALATHFGDGQLGPDRCCRRHRRRRRPRSGPRRDRLARVPRGGGARSGRLERLLRRLPRARLTTGLHLLGVRHHGPGSARSVLRALDEIEPEAVLIELPADCAAVLRGSPTIGLQPPVALLGYLPSDVSRAAFWPLADFSPEWQAARWAYARGVPRRADRRPDGLGARRR